MIAGHDATALTAHQKLPKGTLLFFLAVSQFQDICWFIFHYLGREPTGLIDVFDATIATVSFRDLFGLPVVNLAFNTTVPTIILTYIAMTAVLFWAVTRTVKAH